MSSPEGSFVWYELMTSDMAAAEAFYRAVIGWNTHDSGMAGWSYTILSAGEASIGGVMKLPDEVAAHGGRPSWIGYVGVADVDAVATQLVAAGGTIHRPAADIPGVGRFAVVADPHGAVFVLFTPTGAPPPAQVAHGTPGHVGWHELQAGKLDDAFAFYAGLFGWTKTMAVDMGPMGLYQTFATGGEAVGGMMTKASTVPMPFWLYYFIVPAVDDAVARVTAAGGEILNGPMQVPGGSWIVQCRDPQGALFAMVGPQR